MNKRKLQKAVLWVLPVFFFLVVFKELYIAQQYAEIANLEFIQALSLWASETDPNATYSGAQMGLKLRIDRAIYSFIILALFIFVSFKMVSIDNDKNT